MEKVEDIYDFILKTRFEYWIEDVLKDIKIIEFAILCQNVEYKKNIYNKMQDKYAYYLDLIGYGKAIGVLSESLALKNLSEGQKVKIPYFDEDKCVFNPEKDKIIDPSQTPLIIIDGYFIFRNQKIRDFLNLKIYKEVEDDVRLSRLVLREEKYLKYNFDAYQIYFAIYERFYKMSYDEYISMNKKYANILLPDYSVTEDNELEGDETLELLLSNLTYLSKRK